MHILYDSLSNESVNRHRKSYSLLLKKDDAYPKVQRNQASVVEECTNSPIHWPHEHMGGYSSSEPGSDHTDFDGKDPNRIQRMVL
jgi:hypothetical protein